MNVDPATLARTRRALQAVAEHVMAPARHAATGKIGLRPSPGGFRTPPYPSDAGERTLAVDVGEFVVTDDGGERRSPLTTVAAAAAAAGIEPVASVEAYNPSTPFTPDEPLDIDPAAARAIADWYDLGSRALEAFKAEVAGDEPTETQLWPEHFDLGFSSGTVNWGVSPGDGSDGGPYLYVGPWTAPEPDGEYWNEGYGASRPAADITSVDDAVAFFREGRRRLAG
jgi:hypothetical protein